MSLSADEVAAAAEDAAELADLFDFGLIRPVWLNDDKKALRRSTLFLRMLNDPCDQYIVALNLFAATHLPTLIRVVISQFPPDKLQHYDEDTDPNQIWATWNEGANFVCHILYHAKPYMFRFAREHPDQARELWFAMGRLLASMSSVNEEDFAGFAPSLSNYLATSFYLLVDILIANSLPPTTTTTTTCQINCPQQPPSFLRLDPQCRTSIHAVLLRLENLPNRKYVYTALTGLTSAVGKVSDLVGTRKAFLREKKERKWSFWECEMRVVDVGVGHRAGECVGVEKGREMEVCSQCLCVRYCSIQHQKEHWKRYKHKMLCFKPTW